MKTLLLSLTIVLSLTACGGGSGEGAAPVGPTAVPTALPEAVQAAAQAIAENAAALRGANIQAGISLEEAANTWVSATRGVSGFHDFNHWMTEQAYVEHQISNAPQIGTRSDLINRVGLACDAYVNAFYRAVLSRNDLAEVGFAALDGVALKARDRVCFQSIDWNNATAEELAGLFDLLRASTPSIAAPDMYNSNAYRYNQARINGGGWTAN